MIRDWQTAGWPVVRIRDIGRLHGGGTPSRKRPDFFKGDIPWITSQDISENYVSQITAARDYVTKDAVEESATRVVPAGAVLVTTRVSVGKTAVAGCQICFSQDITAILIHSPSVALPAYVAHFLRSRRAALLQKNQGSTIAGITRDSLALEQIPLPPISEQRRIVEILQEAEEIRRLRAQAEAKTAKLIPSMFSHFFGDGVDRFQNHPMREFVDEFRYGTSQSSGERGATTLRIPNILGDRISFDDLVKVNESDDALERLQLQTGDMLFVRTNGNPDYVGRCCVFDEADAQRETGEGASIIFASYLIRARLKPNVIRPWFLHAFLRSSLGRARVLKQARTAAGQYNINTEGLGAIRIPVPPIEIQDRFLLESTETQQITEVNRRSEKEAIALAKSLSAHAFSGQLTERWRAAHQAKVAREAALRDEDLKIQKGGPVLINFGMPGSRETPELFEIPEELSREQLRLLISIRTQWARREFDQYFTAEILGKTLDGSLRRNPHVIEGHLAVFAARGLIISVSREEQTEDKGEFVFGTAYRLPLPDQKPGEGKVGESSIGDHSRLRELERLAAQLEKERALT